MEYKSTILKYLHDLKIMELSEKLESKGYSVSRDTGVDSIEFDIVAENREGHKLFIEVKSGKSSPSNKKKLMKMHEYVKGLENASMKIVTVTPPISKTIEVEGIEDTLVQILVNNTPPHLYDVCNRSEIVEVLDVDINYIITKKYDIHIRGVGTVGVEIFMDSHDEDGFYESFPLEFDLLLDKNMEVIEVNVLDIDVSSFFE